MTDSGHTGLQDTATRSTPSIVPGGPGWAAHGTSGPFTTDPGWLPFHPQPSRPRFRLPPGSVDAHCHVFGPGERFPFAPERKYTPCDASREKLWALRDFLGFERNVLVQATCHGGDNRAVVDALRMAGDRARGIATITTATTDAELAELDAAGIRGARFNFVKRLVDVTPPDVLAMLARRIAAFGWHVVVYFEAPDLPDLESFLRELPTPVIVDHMGRPDVSKPVDGPEFERFVGLMRTCPRVWSKVTCPDRLSVTGPPLYTDFVPFARRLVEEFPDRVLWGTDWPHPNLRSHMPDDGALVDLIPAIAPTEVLQRKLLVDNPRNLYWGRQEA